MMKPPPRLKGEALIHFKKLAKELEHRSEEYHADALARYCEACVITQTVVKRFNSFEAQMEDVSEHVVDFKRLWDAVKDAYKTERELGAELGLSPAVEATKKMDTPAKEAEETDPHAAAKARIAGNGKRSK